MRGYRYLIREELQLNLVNLKLTMEERGTIRFNETHKSGSNMLPREEFAD